MPFGAAYCCPTVGDAGKSNAAMLPPSYTGTAGTHCCELPSSYQIISRPVSLRHQSCPTAGDAGAVTPIAAYVAGPAGPCGPVAPVAPVAPCGPVAPGAPAEASSVHRASLTGGVVVAGIATDA